MKTRLTLLFVPLVLLALAASFTTPAKTQTALPVGGGLTLPFVGSVSTANPAFRINNNGAGIGIQGNSPSGIGVYGSSRSSKGVVGFSASNIGVHGSSHARRGPYRYS